MTINVQRRRKNGVRTDRNSRMRMHVHMDARRAGEALRGRPNGRKQPLDLTSTTPRNKKKREKRRKLRGNLKDAGVTTSRGSEGRSAATVAPRGERTGRLGAPDREQQGERHAKFCVMYAVPKSITLQRQNEGSAERRERQTIDTHRLGDGRRREGTGGSKKSGEDAELHCIYYSTLK